MSETMLDPYPLTDVPVAPAPGRLRSLDAFRGLTLAGMILVNNSGGRVKYAPLGHADWHGWTPTDLVFPFFVFIMGVSIAFALARRLDSGAGLGRVLLKIVWRAVAIFGLGLLLNWFPFSEPFAELRIPGVLQRIAICYLFAALIFLATGPKTQLALIVVLLLGYWAALTRIPVPGYELGDLSLEGNVAAHYDKLLLTPAHLYKKTYDPEGLLSTIPALATALIGTLTGRWLRGPRSMGEKCAGMFVVATPLVIAGLAWNEVFPINKALWTGPFVLLTAGLALHLLGLFYWIVDIQGWRRWAAPLVVFGVNPIAAYVLSGLGGQLLRMSPSPSGGMNLREWMYSRGFESWLTPINASLGWAVAYVLFWLLVMTFFYRKNIIIRL
jgi:predicted acyltransferase